MWSAKSVRSDSEKQSQFSLTKHTVICGQYADTQCSVMRLENSLCCKLDDSEQTDELKELGSLETNQKDEKQGFDQMADTEHGVIGDAETNSD